MTVSRLVLATAAAALGFACAPQSAARYDRQQLAARLADAQVGPGLVVGEFVLASPAVVDGDTIKVVGVEGTLRLLGIDTEETFKSDKDRRAYDEGFDVYLAKKQEGHSRPIKAATPLGMDAKHWAEEFFDGVRVVRLERDHPRELRGRYGRLLTYVMVEKQGRTLNYNVECVRAGMSPYFSKYGYSRRFHDDFVRAQDEARAARRGIWDPKLEHYPDYDVRLRWWDARADVIQQFEQEANGRDNWVMLTNWDSLGRLEGLEGQEVVVLATIGDIKPREGKGPARVMLSRRMFSDFPLIFFDDEVLERSGVEQAKGEFVRVQGTVTRYEFRQRRKRNKPNHPPPSQLQMQIKRAEQISFVDTRPSRIAAGYAPIMPEDETPPVEPPVPEPSDDEPAAPQAEPETSDPAAADPDRPPPPPTTEEPVPAPPPPPPDADGPATSQTPAKTQPPTEPKARNAP
ncbi:MAG: thermonuclease family protein [Deltaproteobacteria bacterium]|nr:thermonuclease family protein [Deltaproteobacteria bacterium]